MFSYCFNDKIIKIPNNKNINKYGNNTINHETFIYPLSHKNCNNKVNNII